MSREIDALVAEKVMGMKFYEARPMFASDLYTDERGVIVDLPFYSTNIAAAWMVVEKMRVDWQFGLSDWWRDDKAQFRCIFTDLPEEVIRQAVAETAPRAICLAALKAVGVYTQSPKEKS